MVEISDIKRERADSGGLGAQMNASEADAWFIREVLPLEATLMLFLHQNWRNKAELPDLRQEVYMRVYEAALQEIPEKVKPFVLTTARNLLINRARSERVIPITIVSDLDVLGIASDQAGPDRVVVARNALQRLQLVLDHLPPRCREVVILRKVEGLSRREIAARMGIAELTVKVHLTKGMRALADALHGESVDLGRFP